MTNIATMLQKYPDASDLLKGLYVINGYFGAEVLPGRGITGIRGLTHWLQKLCLNLKLQFTEQFCLKLRICLL